MLIHNPERGWINAIFHIIKFDLVAGLHIKNQKEHHKSENFHDEFKRLLIENEIEFDEK